MPRPSRVVATTTAALLTGLSSFAQSLGYQRPPEPIQRLLDAPATPTALVSPDRTTLLMAQPATFPTIADLARPRYRLAGLRFNPQSNGPSRELYSVRLWLQPAGEGPERPITGHPAVLKASAPAWSPDGRQISFVQRSDGAAPESTSGPKAASQAGLELWVVNVTAARAHRVGTLRLNAVWKRHAPGCPTQPGCSAGWCPRTVGRRRPRASCPPGRTSRRTWARSPRRGPMRTRSGRRPIRRPADGPARAAHALPRLRSPARESKNQISFERWMQRRRRITLRGCRLPYICCAQAFCAHSPNPNDEGHFSKGIGRL